MIVPVVKKVTDPKKVLIERSLPNSGVIRVNEGFAVEPFTRVGECMHIYNELSFERGFKPEKHKGNKKYIRQGYLIGTIGKDKVKAPYNGILEKSEFGKYHFSEEEKRFSLLSGVWGIVRSIYENRSVLLEAVVKDLLFSVSTPIFGSGELVVLPNPSDILKDSYLEKFSKGVQGKIVYIGHYVDKELVAKANDLGSSAIISGSCSYETFAYAKHLGIGLGLISGFGRMDTPDFVFDLMESISNRYVFFNGLDSILRIPIPPEDLKGVNINSSFPLFKELKKGTSVWVLEKPYFGMIGTVDSISDSSILVKFTKSINAQEVKIPNFFIVEK